MIANLVFWGRLASNSGGFDLFFNLSVCLAAEMSHNAIREQLLNRFGGSGGFSFQELPDFNRNVNG
jgi:hypothetical protein